MNERFATIEQQETMSRFRDGYFTFAECMLRLLYIDGEIKYQVTRESICEATAIAHRMEREALEKDAATIGRSDLSTAHEWLCHPGEVCKDGCDVQADPKRAAAYDKWP